MIFPYEDLFIYLFWGYTYLCNYLTYEVINDILSITMTGISTITQKGQIAIPKAIRDHFNLTPSSKIRFIIEKGRIIGQPLPSIHNMLGFVSTTKKLSKEQEKNSIKKRTLQKYENNT